MLFLKFSAVILFLGTFTQIQGEGEDVDIALWPDLSCHPGYDRNTIAIAIGHGWFWCRRTTPAPNFPDGESAESMGSCAKFCALGGLDLLNYSEDGVELQNSYTLEEYFGEDLGPQLSQKVIAECGEMFKKVLYEDFHSCNSEEADKVYDCIENALKC